ncbi:MAG: hypothetical protein FWG17_00495 [Desulfovibrionaceae bacterium]|nr:hypothetical protein [Desulfovibrionaceae bacterium]
MTGISMGGQTGSRLSSPSCSALIVGALAVPAELTLRPTGGGGSVGTGGAEAASGTDDACVSVGEGVTAGGRTTGAEIFSPWAASGESSAPSSLREKTEEGSTGVAGGSGTRTRGWAGGSGFGADSGGGPSKSLLQRSPRGSSNKSTCKRSFWGLVTI